MPGVTAGWKTKVGMNKQIYLFGHQSFSLWSDSHIAQKLYNLISFLYNGVAQMHCLKNKQLWSKSYPHFCVAKQQR